jgi:outer membrane protein assembly factor BamE (lipoprotein component of BamABCDE complex)
MMLRTTLVLVAAFTLAGCASNPASTTENTALNSPFTHGNVQLTLKNGVTTQADVLEKFGAPNIATVDSSGNEVWTYQKNATVSKSNESSAYGTVVLFGGSSSSSGFEQSSRTMTMILKFDESKKVIDFKSMTTSF